MTEETLLEARKRIKELEEVMQEAIENCEICREHELEVFLCARCQTFLKLLTKNV